MALVRKVVASAAVVSLLGFVGASNASTIDLFTQPLAPALQAVGVGGLNNALPDESQLTANDGSIIGAGNAGYRDLALINVNGTTTSNGATLIVGNGRLSWAEGPGVDSTAVVQWDGDDAATPGTLQYALGANLINQLGCPVGGCTYFQTTVFNADQGFGVELGVFTDADTFSLLRFTSAAVSTAQPSIFEFAWFDTAGLNQQVEPGFFVDVIHGSDGKADFNNVGALQLLLDGSSATGQNLAIDLEIGGITKNGVPEPGTLALAGLALIGAAAARRRRVTGAA